MEATEVKQLIEAGIEGAEARVAGAGDRFDLIVIADHFDGLSKVRRQQAVYGCINHLMADNTIHAVNIQTYTCEQWQTAQSRGLV